MCCIGLNINNINKMADVFGWRGEDKPGLFTLYKSQQKQMRTEGRFTIVDRDGRSRESIDQQQNASFYVGKNVIVSNKQRSCRNNMIYQSFLRNAKPKFQRLPNLIENCEEVQNKMDKITKILHLDNKQRYKASTTKQDDIIIKHQRKKKGVRTQNVQKSNIFLSIEAIKQKYFKGKKCINFVHHKKNSDYQAYKTNNQRVAVKKVLKINDFFKLNEKLETQKQSQVVYLSVKKQQANMNPLKYLIIGEKRPYICTDKDRFSPNKQTKDFKCEPQISYQRSLHRQRSPRIKFISQRLKSEGRVSEFRQANDNSLQLYRAQSKMTLRKQSKIIKYKKNVNLVNGHHINLL